MKSKIAIAILSVALILVSSALFIQHQKYSKSQDADTHILKSFYLCQTLESVINDGTEISNEVFLDRLESDGNQDEDMLVVCYSQYSCTHCIEYAAKAVETYVPGGGHNMRVLFVASDFRGNDYTEYGNMLMLPFNSTLGIQFEESHTPFMFIYNHGIRHFFIPEETIPEITDIYFNSILERYDF